MKVQDNLENYEIPRGFRLTVEGEDSLAAIIAEIIPELVKRRNSKLETRKYFKQHLRYDSNVLEDLASKGITEDAYEFGQNYTPLEGEYTWRSNLLQPVLLEILYVERLKYGYIINLLQDDMRRRNPQANLRYWEVEDHLIKFTNEFDLDDIRDRIAEMSDIRKRIVYLQTKKADLLVTDLLSVGEKQDWVPEYEDKLNALIALEEKKLELYPSGHEGSTPVSRNEPKVPEKKDYYAIVYKYCEEDGVARDKAYHLILKGINFEKEAVEKSVIEEIFSFVEEEFARFLESCEVLSNDKIKEIFMFVDQWFDHFKDSVDDAFSHCQQSIKVSVRKKTTPMKREVLNKMALIYAHFIVEKAIVVVSSLKANILYNHRYVEEVFYNIKGITFEAFIEEMQEMEGKFGGGDERDMMFDRDACIEAFYDKILEHAKFGLLEVSHEADTMDDTERLSLYRGLLEGEVKFGLPFYIDLVKTHPDISTEIYHEAVSWVETTRYCMTSVLLAVELWVGYDEDRFIDFDLAYFQRVNFDYIPQLLSDALQEFTSDTGNYEIDDKMNDLGERDADEWDAVVPVFDPEVITDDFIPEEEYKKAIDIMEEEDYRQNGVPVKLPPIRPPEGGPYTYVVNTEHIAPKESVHILLEGKSDDVISYINSHIDRKVPTNAICLLIAARMLSITDNLTHSVAEDLFGKFASRSTYNAYYNGSRTVNSSLVETYKKALEQHFISPPSSPE